MNFDIAPEAMVKDHHQALLDLAQEFSIQPQQCQALGELLLGKRFEQGLLKGGISELNNDGSALQLCLSSSDKGMRFRIIADPAAATFLPADRLKASLECLDAILQQTGTESLGPLCHQLFAPLLSNTINLELFDRGFCWIGASPDQPGLAFYTDTRPLGKQAWTVIGDYLKIVLPQADEALRVIDNLRPYAQAASLGFEALNPQTGRAKFYWRLKKAVALSALKIAPLATPAMAYFLKTIIGQQPMNYSGMVMSAGFDLSSGALEDVKIDLCGHCLPKPSEDWLRLIKQCCDTFRLPYFPVNEVLKENKAEVAFLGMGMSTKDQPRMNLYLKPFWQPLASAASETLGAALVRARDQAIAYLAQLQSPEGSWTDYWLPVGPAVEWVTAYTGIALAQAGKQGDCSSAWEMAEKAGAYLREKRAYPLGWGYNHRTGPDADSTGFALRLLQALSQEPASAEFDYLRSFWKAEGGFCTYQQEDHWGDRHPCVTAAAALALTEDELENRRLALIDYLRQVAPPAGEWPTYWWSSHLYSTYQHLLLLQRLGLSESDFTNPPSQLQLPDASSPFELALAAGIAHHRNQDASVFLTRLIGMQQIDGRFPGAYHLRVTDPDCEAHWRQLTGIYYKDIAGSITTATVIQVLTTILNPI